MNLDIDVAARKMTPSGATSSNSAGHVAHLMKLRTKVNMGRVLDTIRKSKTLRLERGFCGDVSELNYMLDAGSVFCTYNVEFEAGLTLETMTI